MGERHADALFSLAYDGELDPGARRRFDGHLDGCARCAAAFDEYRTALDAVRALPVATMPATVRLPVGPPQPAAGRAAALARLRDALLHPRPVGAAAALATVGILAVVLAVHHGGNGVTSSGVSSDTALGRAYSAQEAPGAGSAAGAAPMPHAPEALSAPSSPCLVTAVAPSGSTGSPSGYGYVATGDVGSGLKLVLATPADGYAPGDTVPIYARLSGMPAGSGGSDIVPCVTLQQAVPAQAAAGAPAGGSAGQFAPAAPAPAPASPLAVATAAPASADRSAKNQSVIPQLSLTIPPDIPHGTHLRLVAFIPAYAKGNTTGHDLEVTLDITVR